MAKILDKKLVSPAVYELVIEAPLIARKCKPGQFVIVLSDPANANRVNSSLCYRILKVSGFRSPLRILTGKKEPSP